MSKKTEKELGEETRIDPVEAVEPESAVDDMQTQLDKMKDQWLRSVAELENTRRRAQKDRDDAHKYATASFSRDILGVYDSLTKAIEVMGQTDQAPDEIKGFVEGVNLTLTELDNVFSRHGINKLNPLNQPFDPNFHQAMFEVPSKDVEPGTVVQVVQIGFTIHDRLLRPALVGVSKKGE